MPEPTYAPHAVDHYTDPAASVEVWYDLFPSEVAFVSFDPATGPSELTLPKCRTLIGPSGVYVFTDGPRGPVLAFYDAIDPNLLRGALSTGFDVVPVSPGITGVTDVRIRPTSACGCGSRLRGYRPFGRIAHRPTPELLPLGAPATEPAPVPEPAP